jgi:hypothetical protein
MKHCILLITLCAIPFFATAEPVDVYILSGQSNMQGVGNLSDLSPAQRTRNTGMENPLNPSPLEKPSPVTEPNASALSYNSRVESPRTAKTRPFTSSKTTPADSPLIADSTGKNG